MLRSRTGAVPSPGMESARPGRRFRGRIVPPGWSNVVGRETEDMAGTLLAEGANVNAKAEDGTTALHRPLRRPSRPV